MNSKSLKVCYTRAGRLILSKASALFLVAIITEILHSSAGIFIEPIFHNEIGQFRRFL